MGMLSIFEFGYRYVIPSIKRRLIEKLVEMGLTRKEAARKIGLSPLQQLTRTMKPDNFKPKI